ncbi:MAG: histidine kinase, partial [Acidobacteria bacterium]
MMETISRPSPESLLAKLNHGGQAKLRVYIGAAPGVGKTYQMLEDAHLLKKQGVDIAVAVVEAHDRQDTTAMIGDLECLPLRHIEYRGVTMKEMDVEAVIERHPAIAIVDELAHTNVPGSKNPKRYQDVLDLLAAGISVITAV